MMLSSFTSSIRSGQKLSSSESAGAVDELLNPSIAETEKELFLLTQMQRGLEVDELVGFAQALLPRAQVPTFCHRWNQQDIFDCCGTGGGGLNLLNISTGMIFILAAAGVPVVKHGNRGVTKKSGSADVLDALGVQVDLSPVELEEAMGELGWGFIYAPSYHPAFKIIAPVRKKLALTGQKTIFNYLGPLLNPVRPNAQLVGVFDEQLLDLYRKALLQLGCANPVTVFGRHTDGTPVGEVGLGENRFSASSPILISPNGPSKPLESILVQNAEESAQLLQKILARQEQALGYQMLVRNAGLAFSVLGKAANLAQGEELARKMIDSGQALETLNRSRTWAKRQK